MLACKLLLPILLAAAVSSTAQNIPSGSAQFDEHRDAVADIRDALAEARRSGRRVLLDVGGDWCMYCAQMDDLFRSNPDLVRLRDQRFVTVRVFYGGAQTNAPALSRYPPPQGIPHFYVLRSDGSLVRSQHLTELREGDDYSHDKMKGFLEQWSGAR